MIERPTSNRLLGIGIDYATHPDQKEFVLDRRAIKECMEESLWMSEEIRRLTDELKEKRNERANAEESH